MTTTPSLAGLPPVHPGQILSTAITAIGKPKSEIADLLGVSRQTLYDVLSGKQSVTAPMALRVGKLIGNGPDLWLNLQAKYDLRRAKEEIGAVVEKIPTLEAADA